MYLPSDALLQHLPSYLGFSYLGCGVSLHSCSSKAQPLLLTLDEWYLLTAALPDLQRGIDPLGPPAPTQPLLLGHGVGPPGCHPWPRTWEVWGSSSWPLPLTPDWVAPLGGLCRRSLALSATAPDLGHGVTPLGRRPSGMGSSRLLPLTSDVGYLFSAALSALVAAPAICKIASRKLHKELHPVQCDYLKGWDGVGRWEGGSRGQGRMYIYDLVHTMYTYLIHTVVQQKPTQRCKAVILQLKIKKRIK